MSVLVSGRKRAEYREIHSVVFQTFSSDTSTTFACTATMPLDRASRWQLVLKFWPEILGVCLRCCKPGVLQTHYLHVWNILQRAAKLCKRSICYGISVPPSVRLSVRPSHSGIMSKRGNAEGCGFHHQIAQFLEFRVLDGGDPVQVKFECKEVDPLWKQPVCTYFAS